MVPDLGSLLYWLTAFMKPAVADEKTMMKS
jgi:hypothetical protein